jgi:hypothetical protein
MIPAFGKISEIGIMAEPMIPKAWRIPCIWSVFTKASSVVIFMGQLLKGIEYATVFSRSISVGLFLPFY